MTQAVLLEDGLVVDGTGGAAQPGDVLLVGDRIAAVGPGLRDQLPAGLSLADVDVRDCAGMAIAPGFIDVHTHDDAIVLAAPGMFPKLSQGITTVVTGNCGLSVAPFVVDEPKGALTLLACVGPELAPMRFPEDIAAVFRSAETDVQAGSP